MATVVHHFGMTVADIEETQVFYGKHFGFAPSEESIILTEGWFGRGVAHAGAQAKIGWLRRDDAVIELHEYVEPTNGRKLSPDITDISAPHIAFKVDDIDAMREQLLADGVRFYSAPVEVSSDGSASQLGGIRWCYCEDPNGYIVEIFAEPRDSTIDWEGDVY
jgi:catechol 2,3-dioxygenase-like lactoylglutathione lyase family enzyme